MSGPDVLAASPPAGDGDARFPLAARLLRGPVRTALDRLFGLRVEGLDYPAFRSLLPVRCGSAATRNQPRPRSRP